MGATENENGTKGGDEEGNVIRSKSCINESNFSPFDITCDEDDDNGSIMNFTALFLMDEKTVENPPEKRIGFKNNNKSKRDNLLACRSIVEWSGKAQDKVTQDEHL